MDYNYLIFVCKRKFNTCDTGRAIPKYKKLNVTQFG